MPFSFTQEQEHNLTEWKQFLTIPQYQDWEHRFILASQEFNNTLKATSFDQDPKLDASQINSLFHQMKVLSHNRALSKLLYEDNGLDNFNSKLRALLFGGNSIVERFEEFIQLRGISETTASHFLCLFNPREFPYFSSETYKPLNISNEQQIEAQNQATAEFSFDYSKYSHDTVKYFEHLIVLRAVKNFLNLTNYSEVNSLLWRGQYTNANVFIGAAQYENLNENFEPLIKALESAKFARNQDHLFSLEGLFTIDDISDVLSPDEKTNLESSCQDKIVRMWGAGENKASMMEEYMRPDSYVVFFYQNKYLYKAKIALVTTNSKLAERVWGNAKWEHLFFVKDLRRIQISNEKFARIADYKDNFRPSGLMHVNKLERAQQIIEWLENPESIEDEDEKETVDALIALRFEQFKEVLNYKKQIIFYGPPGTGKTFLADYFARLTEPSRSHRKSLTFHQSYSYEEFFEGIRPIPTKTGQLDFHVVEGIFKEFCRFAENELMSSAGLEKIWNETEDAPCRDASNLSRGDADKLKQYIAAGNYPHFFLLIDEINRADISRVFGEAITLIESDKRLHAQHESVVSLPYSRRKFGVPPNLFIIGTMNTADRSIALLDVALRRRFAFIELMPDYAILLESLKTKEQDLGLDLRTLVVEPLRKLNERLVENYNRDHQVGHSYFMSLRECKSKDEFISQLKEVWFYEVIPLLQEYFYDNEDKLRKVLGKQFFQTDETGTKLLELTVDDAKFIGILSAMTETDGESPD